MNSVNDLLDNPLAFHLGWTLVHFLWQGALLGILYRGMRFLTKDATPESRYWLSLGTLLILAVVPVFTFIHLSSAIVPPSIGPGALNVSLATASIHSYTLAWLRELLHALIPWTVPAWSVGVALMSFKSFIGWRKVNLLTRNGSHQAPPVWQETVQRLALAIGMRIRVQLTVTVCVTVPCVVGWIRPVILLPPSALTGLTPLQLEMVLAHELAHIRRHDYLINLLQVSVETLLFYHPVVRWVSRDARNERELCCDDSAVHACGNALDYAHALADLASLRCADTRLAIAADGGELTLRVERLITSHYSMIQPAPRITTVMLASAIFLSGILMLASAQQTGLHTQSVPMLSATVSNSLSVIHAVRGAAAPTVRTFMRTEVHSAGTVTATYPMIAVAANPAQLASLSEVAPPQEEHMDTADIAAATHSSTAGSSTGAPYGDSLSTYTGQISIPDLHQNKHAVAQLKIIALNGQDDNVQAKNGHHDYCEPITGSRVCR